MHVQGISHWAPANIGPYSQAVKVGVTSILFHLSVFEENVVLVALSSWRLKISETLQSIYFHL